MGLLLLLLIAAAVFLGGGTEGGISGILNTILALFLPGNGG